MRQDYAQFAARGAEIVVVNPESQSAARDYWEREALPFVGLADPRHQAASLYGQKVSWLKLGRLPALAIVDRDGRLRYRHFGDSMADIPENSAVLSMLDGLSEDTVGL